MTAVLLEAPAGGAHEAPGAETAPQERQAGERVRRNVAALGAGQVFTWAMSLAWTLTVPRLLGAGGMGLVWTGFSVAAILQIALGAGTASYVVRQIVISPERAARMVATASIARIALVPLFTAGVVVWAQLAGYSVHQDLVLYLCSAATALMLIGEPLTSYFQATERMHYMAIADGINKASQGLGGIVMAALGFGAAGIGWCWVVTAAIVVVLSLRWARRYDDIRPRTTVRDLRDIARGSAVYWTGGLFFTIYAWIDSAMLSVMTNPTVVGWYGVPMRLWGTFLVIPTIATRAWLPRLVRAGEQSRGELERVARAPVAFVFALSLPVATLLAVGAGPGVPLIYGPSYHHAVPVLIILGLNLVPMYLNIMLATICVAANRQRTWNWMMVGATIFNPAVNAFLIPYTQHRFGNGAIGAAIALALTEVVVASAGVAVVGRRVLGRQTVSRIGRMAVACGGMWLTVHLLAFTGAVPSMAAGCCALAVLAVLLGAITPQERQASAGQALALAARIRALRHPTAPVLAPPEEPADYEAWPTVRRVRLSDHRARSVLQAASSVREAVLGTTEV